MEREPGLKWLFLDLNSYFASVEQQERPELRGKPVAIVPMPTDSTCAIAASYEAKAYGVTTGTKIYEAKKMCPSLRCVLARHHVYVDYHHRVIEEVVKYTPIRKIWSIDELDSLLPPGKRSVDAAQNVAQKIKDVLRKNVGEHVRCSIGIAPNSLLAKIATDMQKPDGLVLIRQEDLPGPLLNLRLIDIPGIGVNMERRLIRGGISTMDALWHSSPKQLRKIWGSVEGERMWYWLHGYDFPRPETKDNVVIGHSRVLDPQLRSPETARLMARRLLVKATYRLRHKGYYASTLSFGVRFIHGGKWRNETRFIPAQDPFTFLQALETLWSDLMAHLPQQAPPIRFKKVSVALSGLKRKEEITEDLFDARSSYIVKSQQKRESLAHALDHLQGKYKKETVSLGVPPKTLSGHVGTKIAFSRVPEREEFWSS